MFEESTFTDGNGRELSFEDMMAASAVENANHLANDPEWSEKIVIHIHSVINAFILGVNQSYPYYRNYKLPPNFDKVINRMSELIHEEFREQLKDHECIVVSLLKLKGVYRRLAMAIPEYVAWNDIGVPDGDSIVSRYSETENSPSFIDLDVPPHNAALYLRNCERDSKRFEEEFERKYGKLGDM